MLKHLPTDSLKTIQKTHLYSKNPVYFASTLYERRHHNSTGVVLTGLNAEKQKERKEKHAKDLNIDERITLFKNQLKDEFVYRIPLRYFSDIGKINFPTKTDYRLKLNYSNIEKFWQLMPQFQKLMQKLPSLERLLFSTNKYCKYLETIMVSKKMLRMGAQKTPIQKTYEIQKGSDSLNVEFLGSNRQFDWIEISIVPDKSDKHTTIHDSYNREMAAQLIKSLNLSNFTEIYSLTNKQKIQRRQPNSKIFTLQTVCRMELQRI